MPEERDRLVREEPMTPLSSNRRSRVGSPILLDNQPERVSRFSIDGERRLLFESPLRMQTNRGIRGSDATGLSTIRASPNVTIGRVGYRNSRLSNGRGRGGRVLSRSPSVGIENLTPPGAVSRRGRACGRNSLLPSWYPRTPLRDITAFVNAIERRRNRTWEEERQGLDNPSPPEVRVPDTTRPNRAAPLEHNMSLISPSPTAAIKACSSAVGNMPKLLLKGQNKNESDFMTPQKKLLNSIDLVEKVVMEDLQRLKRTPIARRVEREKKVRTLMAMR